MERKAPAYCDRSPEVESNTRWSSVWRQAVKEQCCLDNCDASLMIITHHLGTSSPHICNARVFISYVCIAFALF